jgi:GNAT superfamily N-acetyltransferase
METLMSYRQYKFQTHSGRHVALRRVVLQDQANLIRFLQQLSDQSRYLRYMSGRPWTPVLLEAEATRMARGHTWPRVTLLVTTIVAGEEAIVAVGELVRAEHSKALADVAFVVHDDFQGDGIGRVLAEWVVAVAQTTGVTTLSVDTHATNEAMRRLARRMGTVASTAASYGEVRMLITPPADGESPASKRLDCGSTMRTAILYCATPEKQ